MSESNLTLMLRSRADFFRRYRTDRNIASFLSNESRLISLINAEQSTNILRNISISLSPALGGFFEPVTVAPTAAHITAAFTTPSPRPDGSCPICQENFDDTSPLIRLRNCNHCFHSDCAHTWYRMSVYCPVCRNDIRT